MTLGGAAPRRAHCPTCLRPQATCLCRWVSPVHSATTVLILQHPLEVDHAKNTGRLLHLSLPNSRLLVGESWTEQVLADAGLSPQASWLLYPRAEPDETAWTAPASPLPPHSNPAPGPPTSLVVLDATWRKSRKMLHLSPWLQALPRLALDDTPASRYAIRKAHRPGQLSTLEATCAALALLGGVGGDRFEPLLRGFDGFVAQQLAWVGRRAHQGRADPMTDVGG